MAGRYFRATTDTPIGPLTVIGVCIPWSHARITAGRRDRAAWQDHGTYLDHLRRELEAVGRPVVLAGDINQRIPRHRQPRRVAEQLDGCMDRMEIATVGRPGFDGLIDHVAHSADLHARRASIIEARATSPRIAVHDGVVVDLRPIA